MENVTIFFALFAGFLSFFSPCIFPLVPAYITHLTGSKIEDGKINIGKKILMARSVAFILGFSIVFVMMGASASFIGQFFMENRKLIGQISGILIMIFGLQMVGILKLKFLMMEKKWGDRVESKSFWSSALLGFAFGSGWTPCVGLALSSILLLAGSTETIYQGMYLLWIYSLGLGLPFLLISLLLSYSLAAIKKINRFLPILAQINGWILIGLGVLLYTGQMQKISAWLAQFTYFNF